MIEIYDLRGLNCPLPVLKARKRLSLMAAGGRLWLETTDPLAAIDVPAFSGKTAIGSSRRSRLRAGSDF